MADKDLKVLPTQLYYKDDGPKKSSEAYHKIDSGGGVHPCGAASSTPTIGSYKGDETRLQYLGVSFIGEYGTSYDCDEISLQSIAMEKLKNKKLEFYAGNVGYWYSVVIMDLDEYDYEEYYKSDDKKRYLYLLKTGDYNFSTKDDSVYDVYSAFGSSIKDMKYAALLE